MGQGRLLYCTVYFVSPKVKCFYAEALIQKQYCWPKGDPGDLIDTYFEDKEVGDVGMIEARTEDNKLFKYFV